MRRRLRLIALAALAIVTVEGRASAQIVLGGEPVATSSGDASARAPAALKIDFDDVSAKSVALVVADFSAEGTATVDMAKAFAAIIRDDLASSGLFAPVDPAAWSALEAKIAVKPVFSEWIAAGVQLLVVGSVSIDASSRINVQFRLYDTSSGEQIFGRQYSAMASGALRRLAHKSADNVYALLTGGEGYVGEGYFDSRIAFVSEAGGKAQAAVIDADGATVEKLLSQMNSIRRPRWAPVDTTLVYSANGGAALYYLETGRREPALDAKPQPAPDLRFSADGRSLIYSRKISGNDEIGLLSLATRKEQVLTTSPASDTAPSLSPDGKLFVFLSDRDGKRDLYVSAVDGHAIPCAGGASTACRITTAGGYANPAWSPKGNFIAFERTQGAETVIGLIDPDGSKEKNLTSGAKDNSPTWSPNGRVLAFARATGNGSRLWTIDRAGRNLRQLLTPADAYEPDWGPLLK